VCLAGEATKQIMTMNEYGDIADINLTSECSTVSEANIGISIVLPVYNEEGTVASTLSSINESMESIALEYEILVVNDGSRDRTLERIMKEKDANPRIKVISYEKNRGKGHAIRAGILHSKGDVILFLDGDSEIQLHKINRYLVQLKDHDILIGSKRHPLSTVEGAPFSRKILSSAFHIMVRVGTGVKVKDTQSGIKAGKGGVLRLIFQVMRINRFAFDVEFLAIATLLNLAIAEFPIQVRYKNKSSLKVQDIAKMFVDLLVISYRCRIRRWYQKQLTRLNENHHQINIKRQ